MNLDIDSDTIFLEKDIFKKLLPTFLKEFDSLKNSRADSNFGIPFREVWGLALIVAFRKFREPDKKWLFITDKKINDDGAIGSFELSNNDYDINYSENIEQVYLPQFFKRKKDEKYGDYLIRFLKEKKLNREDWYKINKTLLILNDVDSIQGFDWMDFLKQVFPDNQINFSHVYYIGFQGMSESFIKYNIFSFTNQKFRQFLNGQFDLYIYIDGTHKFVMTQEVDLFE